MLNTIARASYLGAVSVLGWIGWSWPRMMAQAGTPLTITESTLVPLGALGGIVVATWWVRGRLDQSDKQMALVKMRLDHGDAQFQSLIKTLKSLPCIKPRTACDILDEQRAADVEADRQDDRQTERHAHDQD
jgi:hypothetical protein